MAIVSSTNYTLGGQPYFKWATADADPITREDQVSGLAQAVESHDHSSTLGLAIKRIQTAATPAALGEVQVNGDELQYYGSGGLKTVSTTGHNHGTGLTRVYARTVVSATYNNTAAVQTFHTGTITGGDMGSTKSLRAVLMFFVTQNTGANQNLIINATLGGVSVGSLTFVLPTGAGQRTGIADWLITNRNAANSQACTVKGEVSEPGVATVSGALRLFASAFPAVNTAANQTFAITVQMGVANANFTVIATSAFVELL